MGALTHNGDVITGLPSTASQINYDNTSSGLSATQVQAAVDELNSNKQPKTDNNLQTTSKETTGAINELKSGLTNLVKVDTMTVTTDSDGDASLGINNANIQVISASAAGTIVTPWVHSGDYMWYVRVLGSTGQPFTGQASITYAYVPKKSVI